MSCGFFFRVYRSEESFSTSLDCFLKLKKMSKNCSFNLILDKEEVAHREEVVHSEEVAHREEGPEQVARLCGAPLVRRLCGAPLV